MQDTFSENDLVIGQAYDENIYVSTKLEAEKLVLNYASTQNVSANILRVGNLTNRFSDNVFQENKEDNAFQNKIKELLYSRSKISDLDQYSFDLTPVDHCANAVVKLAFNNTYNNVYHLLNNHELNVNDVSNIFSSLDLNVEHSSETKWLINDSLLHNTKKINIESTQTLSVLNDLGFKWSNDSNYYTRVFGSILKGD